MSNETKRWLAEILHLLDGRLSPNEFRLVKTDRNFWRRTPFRADSISFTSTSYRGEELLLNAHLGIRHKAVEELCNLTAAALPKKYRSTTITVGGELGNVTGGGWRSRVVRSTGDVPVVAAAFWEDLECRALPYFIRFSKLEEVLRVLLIDNHKSPENIHCVFDLPRAKRAIAATYVLCDLELFEDLAVKKLEFLKTRSKQCHDITEFTALVDILRENWGKPFEEWRSKYVAG